MTDRERTLEMMDRRIASLVTQVVNRARGLSEEMATLATRLGQDGAWSLSSTGEVQREGLDIDLLCARIEAFREARAMIASEAVMA